MAPSLTRDKRNKIHQAIAMVMVDSSSMSELSVKQISIDA